MQASESNLVDNGLRHFCTCGLYKIMPITFAKKEVTSLYDLLQYLSLICESTGNTLLYNYIY